MQLQDFFNSAFALRLAMWLGRNVPPRFGHSVANLISGGIARRKNLPFYGVLCNNLRVVLGPDASEEMIERTAREVLRHAGYVYYDLYHAVGMGEEALLASAKLSQQSDYYLQSALDEGRGAIVVGVHMSNFDLVTLAFARRGIPLQVLGWAAPTDSYEMQNEVRLAGGIDLTPISIGALREATRRLRAGGLVATGIDRPDPFGSGDLISFFGRPARLPTGHVRLALQTGSPVIAGACEYRSSDRTYVVHLAPPLIMEQVGDRRQNVLHNARRVLAIMESFIRAHPEQWLMFHPVWEEDLSGDQGNHRLPDRTSRAET